MCGGTPGNDPLNDELNYGNNGNGGNSDDSGGYGHRQRRQHSSGGEFVTPQTSDYSNSQTEDWNPCGAKIPLYEGCLGQGAHPTWQCMTILGGECDSTSLLWGVNLSGSEPGMYNTSGMDEIILPSGQRATYTYGGNGGSYGLGGSASAYIGLVFNAHRPEDYSGPFASTGGTVSIADVGVTAFAFWDPTGSGVHGFAIGYAPGAQLSYWWNTTAYTNTWSSH